MSERRGKLPSMLGRVARIGAICAAIPAIAGAQDRHRLESQVVSFAQRYLTTDSAARAYDDSVARLNAALDTATVGAFRVAATPRIMAVVRQAASIADRDLRVRFGTSMSRLTRAAFVVRPERLPGELDSARASLAAVDATGHELLTAGTRLDTAAMARDLGSMAVEQLTRDAGAPFESWLGKRLPVDTMTAMEWSQTRLQLVSSWASVSRNCFAGQTSDCVAALGLRETADPVADWFDARSRREAVRQADWRVDSRDNDRRSCLAGDDTTCQRLLRTWDVDPLNRSIRSSFVRLAMQLGGEGAYGRLIETDGGVRERIAAAARVPFDSVVRAWQSDVRLTRVPSDAMSPTIAAASLGWVMLCLGLSLRSSRWR